MDLISVLVITYIAGGEVIENEITIRHDGCMEAAARISSEPLSMRPTIELLDGTRVPLASATCLPACMADGEPLELIALAE